MKNVVLVVVLFSFASYVVAGDLKSDQKGWIVGAGVGNTMLTINPRKQPGAKTTNEDAHLFTVFGGYNFTDWFGLEFDISKSSNFTDKNTNLDADITGTSFAPKFTYHANDNLGLYFKAGLQYIEYNQNVDYYYDDEIIWNAIDPFFGAGLQYSFSSGVRARIDYKYSKLTLERSDDHLFVIDLFDEEIDLTFKAITLTVNYQF